MADRAGIVVAAEESGTDISALDDRARANTNIAKDRGVFHWFDAMMARWKGVSLRSLTSLFFPMLASGSGYLVPELRFPPPTV